jgi:hypothetical protein
VDHQGFAVVEIGQNVLRASPELSHSPTGKPSRKLPWEWNAQVLAPRFDMGKAPPFKHRL